MTTPDWLLSRPVAHRGLHDIREGIPENTMKAFQCAVEHGYAIELDVFVSQDEEVIVFHDDTLERACGRKNKTFNLSTDELSYYHLFGTQETIPLLRDVLKLVSGRTPLLIEIKKQPNSSLANQIILNTLLRYQGSYAIQSFDPRIVLWFAKNAPLIPRGQIAGDFKSERLPRLTKWLLRNMVFNRYTQPGFVTFDHKALPARSVIKAKKRGRYIIGWTVRTPEEASEALNYCENIIFEGFLPNML